MSLIIRFFRLVIFFLYPSICFTQSCNHSFLSDFSVTAKDTYENSIAVIQSLGQSHGTAYLVDQRGYFITAYHVVKETHQNNKALTGYIPSLSSYEVTFEFRIIDVMPERYQDLALIKIQNTDDWDRVKRYTRPLDPEFINAQSAISATCLGYPGSNIEQLNQFPGSLSSSNYHKGNTLRFNIPSDVGNSGGPLINRKGRFLGTLVEYEPRYGSFGYFSIVRNHKKLFDSIPLNAKVINFDRELLQGTLQEKDLEYILRESSNRTTALTNLELYLWGREIAKSPSRYAQIEAWSCIIQAFIDRMRDAEFIANLSHISRQDDLARNFYNSPNPTNHGQEVIRDFSKLSLGKKISFYFLNQQLTVDSVLTSDFLMEDRELLLDQVKIEAVIDGLGRKYLANLFKDYGLNLLKTYKESRRPNSQKSITDLIKSAIAFNWAVKIYEPYQANLYGNDVAESLFKLKAYKMAASVYAMAWNLGFKRDHVKDSFMFMQALSKGTEDIESIPSLTPNSLDKYLAGLLAEQEGPSL